MSEQEASFFSLAELAMLDTSDVAVVMSRLPAAGVFTVRITEASLGMSEPQEGKEPMFFIQYKYEIIEAEPLNKSIDPETLVAKTLSERYTLWTRDFAETIGLLKGRYKKAGFSTDGVLGGVEDSPGWINAPLDSMLKLKIRHYTSKGDERAAFDWVAPIGAIDSADEG